MLFSSAKPCKCTHTVKVLQFIRSYMAIWITVAELIPATSELTSPPGRSKPAGRDEPIGGSEYLWSWRQQHIFRMSTPSSQYVDVLPT